MGLSCYSYADAGRQFFSCFSSDVPKRNCLDELHEIVHTRNPEALSRHRAERNMASTTITYDPNPKAHLYTLFLLNDLDSRVI